MCKFTVSVQPTCDADRQFATNRFDRMPHVQAVETAGGNIVAHVDHPKPFNQTGAASWAKDQFGIHSNMIPAVSPIS